MTILAQLYECEIYYIFEKSDNMISIPRIPINFDPILTENLYIDLWFLKENKSYNLQYKDKLKEFGFINKQNKITALGNVFNKMVQKHQAIGKNVFGYFVEYQILEYLYLSGKGGFTHSYKEKYENSNKTKRELDFAFSRKNGKLEVWEVKSAVQFIHYALEKQKQIEKQIEEYPNIISHRLIVYSLNKALGAEIKNNIIDVMNNLKSKFPNIEFKAEFLFLDFMKNDKQEKVVNSYQALLKHSLKEEHFTMIKMEEKNV